LWTFLVLEVVLRLVSIREGHIERLLGRRGHTVVPIDVPQVLPDVAPRPGSYRRYDALLGWTIAPLGKEEPLYYSDRRGVRCSRREHELALQQGNETDFGDYDIVAIGDSFTHGHEVLFEATWPQVLAEKTRLRVLNLGVGGYGIDQAILRFEYTPVRPHLVILGLIAQDFERARTQVYPPIPDGGVTTKPFFEVAGDGMRIVNQPAIHGEQLRQEFELGPRSTFFQREGGSVLGLFRRHRLDAAYLIGSRGLSGSTPSSAGPRPS
jgi:hypothetical protein